MTPSMAKWHRASILLEQIKIKILFHAQQHLLCLLELPAFMLGREMLVSGGQPPTSAPVRLLNRVSPVVIQPGLKWRAPVACLPCRSKRWAKLSCRCPWSQVSLCTSLSVAVCIYPTPTILLSPNPRISLMYIRGKTSKKLFQSCWTRCLIEGPPHQERRGRKI